MKIHRSTRAAILGAFDRAGPSAWLSIDAIIGVTELNPLTAWRAVLVLMAEGILVCDASRTKFQKVG